MIQQHRDNWDSLTKGLIHLRGEAAAGRKSVVDGLTKEQSTFYEHLANLTFVNRPLPPEITIAMKRMTAEIVEILRDTIGMIDFWNNPAEQARLRGELADALLMADIPEVTAAFDRLAVKIAKLAKSRREQLLEEVGA